MNTPRKPRTMSIKLVGGPLSGRVIDVPRSTERISVGGFWVYAYAGKDGAQVLFAKQPRSRVGRRFITSYVTRTGRHPAVESEFTKPKPVVGRTVRTGQGARRRAAKRAS